MARNPRRPASALRPRVQRVARRGPIAALKARRLARRVAAERRAIRTYYRSVRPGSVLLPPESTRRQFRIAIRRENGKLAFTKIEDRIRKPETLLALLSRAAPH